MPRLPSGFLLKEINLTDPLEFFNTINYLVEIGIKKVGITLEPAVVDVVSKNYYMTIAIKSPSIIVDVTQSVNLEDLGFYRVTKDTWLDYAWIDLQILQLVIKHIFTGEPVKTGFLEVNIGEECSECPDIVILESFTLKYPLRPHVPYINVDAIQRAYSISLKEERVILVVCINGVHVKPLIWLDRSTSIKRLNICKPCPGKKHVDVVLEMVLDVLIYSLKTST